MGHMGYHRIYVCIAIFLANDMILVVWWNKKHWFELLGSPHQEWFGLFHNPKRGSPLNLSRNTIWNQDLLEISRGFQTQLGCRIFSVLKIFAYPHGLLYTVPCISMVHGSIKYKVNSRNSKAITIPNNICTYLSLTATSQPRGYLTTCLNTPFLAF